MRRHVARAESRFRIPRLRARARLGIAFAPHDEGAFSDSATVAGPFRACEFCQVARLLTSAIRSPEFCDRRTRVPIKLHRCSNEWLKIAPHPCWKVQKALDDQGIDYELVKGPVRRGKRDQLERLSGQRIYPVIEFEDGRVYRAESKDMAARIRSGQLLNEGDPAGPPASA
jgi:glutaredoxin